KSSDGMSIFVHGLTADLRSVEKRYPILNRVVQSPSRRWPKGDDGRMTETAVGIICGSFDINDLKECVGQDLNLRTPTGQDPEPCAFDQAWQPTHVAGGCEFVS